MSPTAQLEALLFAAGEPMSKKKLAALLAVSPEALAAGLEALRGELSGRGITLVETDLEAELRTAPEATALVKQLREAELARDLGKAGLEALAVVLYRKDGATRSEIDWIRGVNSGATVRSLLLRGLVERTEDPSDKRKIRYRGTTDALAHLGVAKAADLPRYGELSSEAGKAITASENAEAAEAAPAAVTDTNHGDE